MAADAGGARGRLWRFAPLAIAGILFLLPLIAAPFSREMNWDAADYATWAAMLIGACAAYEIATRLTNSRRARAISGVVIVGIFVLTWVELAVGIF